MKIERKHAERMRTQDIEKMASVMVDNCDKKVAQLRESCERLRSLKSAFEAELEANTRMNKELEDMNAECSVVVGVLRERVYGLCQMANTKPLCSP